MGREEKRERERTVKHLEQRLRRKPTDEEVEQALSEVHRTRGKLTGRPAPDAIGSRQRRSR
jgi:DNA-directed RNA polymerase specialized sigma subunit